MNVYHVSVRMTGVQVRTNTHDFDVTWRKVVMATGTEKALGHVKKAMERYYKADQQLLGVDFRPASATLIDTDPTETALIVGTY